MFFWKDFILDVIREVIKKCTADVVYSLLEWK